VIASSPDGFFALFKPSGLSSAKALNVVKGLLGADKAGFLGTLDVPATGVLPVALGSATKLIAFLPASDKEYIGELVLGINTVTDDLSGEPVERRGTAGLRSADVAEALQRVASRKMQIPPHVSAKRLEGVRGYAAMRSEGRLIDFAPAAVAVRTLTVLRERQDGDLRRLTFRIVVTPGFYVRGFCRDVGIELGCGGAMGRLLRTMAYGFDVHDALSLTALRRRVVEHDLSFLTWGEDRMEMLAGLPSLVLDEMQWKSFEHGVAMQSSLADAAAVLAFRAEGHLAGVGEVRSGTLYPRKVFSA
jgi:tRNA pseudouridine55 synthase